ncbi:MAG: FecR domain-containing protein [Cyclobacteriaceae bacterium]
MKDASDKTRLFQRFIDNQCTSAELEEVWFYIDADQIPAEFEKAIRENFEQKFNRHAKVSPEISGRMYRNIQAKTRARQTPRSRSVPIFRKSMAVAATLSLLLMGGVVYFYAPFTALTSSQEYTTTYGETRHILLPDSTSVVLNANSRLTVATDWSTALDQQKELVREVWLEGEAFFDVKKLAKPTRFVVHTDDLKVEVLGTRFDVNSREQKTRVVLDEGKVKLMARNQPELVMQPGELVELSGENAQFQKKLVNTDTYLSWRHDELIFEATPMTEIIELLENNYGYEVVIQNEAVKSSMLFTGNVPANNTRLLLQMLSETFNISIVQQEKKIVFQ